MLPVTVAPQPTPSTSPPAVASVPPPPPPPPPPQTTPVTPPTTAIPEATKILPDIETGSDLFPFVDEPSPLPSQQPAGLQFSANGKNFSVINKSENSLVAASAACQKNQATIATVTSDSLDGITEKLKSMSQNRIVIGTWNGDSYSLTGTSCLIMHVDYGIYPGICTEASSVLCQL